MCGSRGDGASEGAHDVATRLLSVFLTEMDGLESTPTAGGGVRVVATTNRRRASTPRSRVPAGSISSSRSHPRPRRPSRRPPRAHPRRPSPRRRRPRRPSRRAGGYTGAELAASSTRQPSPRFDATSPPTACDSSTSPSIRSARNHHPERPHRVRPPSPSSARPFASPSRGGEQRRSAVDSSRPVILETSIVTRPRARPCTTSHTARAPRTNERVSERARRGRLLFTWHAVVACVAFIAAAHDEHRHRST